MATLARNTNGDAFCFDCIVEECCKKQETDCCDDCKIKQEILNQLADYKDTGLEPSEIEMLFDTFCKTVEKDYEDIKQLEADLSTYRTAEEQGLLVRLPSIKLYKTLYWIWGGDVMPVKYMGVRGGCVDSDGKYHVNCRMKTLKDRTFVRSVHRKLREYTYKSGDERWFYADDIGKTVFLTREEAERKRKENT